MVLTFLHRARSPEGAALRGGGSRLVRSAVFALLLGSTNARAEPASSVSVVSLRYDVDPSCPSIDVFRDEVRARTPRARFEENLSAGRIFQVSVRVRDGELLGEFAIAPAFDASAVRRVSGRTCPEVISALALIAALAIDPDAATAIPAAQGPPGARQEVPPLAQGPFFGAAPRWPPPGDVARSSARKSATDPGWGASIGLLGVVDPGLGPAPLFGGAAFLEGGYELSRLWRLFVRASVYQLVPRRTNGDTPARFGARVFALDACPLLLDLGRGFELTPCLGYAAGTIFEEGVPHGSIQATHQEDATWRAVVERLHLRWKPSTWLFLEAEATFSEPLVQDTFIYQLPNGGTDTIYAVPGLTAAGGLGLGLELR